MELMRSSSFSISRTMVSSRAASRVAPSAPKLAPTVNMRSRSASYLASVA